MVREFTLKMYSALQLKMFKLKMFIYATKGMVSIMTGELLLSMEVMI